MSRLGLPAAYLRLRVLLRLAVLDPDLRALCWTGSSERSRFCPRACGDIVFARLGGEDLRLLVTVTLGLSAADFDCASRWPAPSFDITDAASFAVVHAASPGMTSATATDDEPEPARKTSAPSLVVSLVEGATAAALLAS